MLLSWLKRNHVKIAGLVVFSAIMITGGLVLSAEPVAGTEVKTKEDSYPLETCIVSGEKLGSMGEPVTYVYEGQEIRFCCAGCIPRFEKDPEKYMKKLGPVEADEAGK